MKTFNKIVVTGGAGFLGTKVVSQLTERGHSAPFIVRSKDYDLTQQSAVRTLLKKQAPDLVVHIAAVVGGIGANRDNPGKFFYDNAMMGIMLMEEARLAGVEKVVLIGTVCAYPKFAAVPFKEDDLWNGYPEETNAPYGLAKKMLLVQAQSYRQQYDFNSIYLLPVNLYGPGDNFDPQSSHVIPAMIRKFVEAKESSAPFVELWGDGTPTREFLYVDDAARGIVMAAEAYNQTDPVNLGSSKEISMKELADLIKSAVGYNGELRWDTTKPNGQPRRKLDVSRAKREFNFEASVSFENGLRRTIDWYVSNAVPAR